VLCLPLMRNLTVLIQVSKTGSSSTHQLFLNAALRNGPHASSICVLKTNDAQWRTESACAEAEVAIGPRGSWGDGDVRRAATPSQRGIRMLTTLREPYARLISEYEYFCLNCAERRKYCGRFVHTGCGTPRRPTFVQWIARAPNQYTRRFSTHWPPRTWFRNVAQGFPNATALDERAVTRAYEALASASTLVLWTEDMTTDGPHQLSRVRAWLGEDSAAAAALRKVSTFPRVNAQRHNRAYAISPTERRAACAANWADCALYKRLRGRICSCEARLQAPRLRTT